ncbi:MAG: TIM barrel protein [Gammaproteobacteria bacterium]|nr:TIM barrel protein [Gammaproteobacteria bacterium]
MPTFAANISTMFDESDELDRLNHAAELGFKHVEWLFPYKVDKRQIKSRLDSNGLELILINTALGTAKGDRGIGGVPGREDEFRKSMAQAIEYATEIDISLIHVMAGICTQPSMRNQYLETFARNLSWSGEQLKGSSIRLLIEPLNQVDTPGYLICHTTEALDLISQIDAAIGLQFDFYHMQIMEGNLGKTMADHIENIGHIQFSSLPGRHEPQYGEVNCQYLFDLLDTLPYTGYVGCEYKPKTNVEEGLSWGSQYGLGSS